MLLFALNCLPSTHTGSPGGHLDVESCQCKCKPVWQGAKCDKCVRKCQRGGVLNKACECDCPKQYHASGDSCEKCDLACAHGGEVHSETCTCSCPQHFSGPFCQKCDLSEEDWYVIET